MSRIWQNIRRKGKTEEIISHTKIILIKHFCIQKKIEVETHWKINKPSNIFLPFYLFYEHLKYMYKQDLAWNNLQWLVLRLYEQREIY